MYGIFQEEKDTTFLFCKQYAYVKSPPELACLNSMEQRLICKVQAFMKLLVLPLGQSGQTINFPVNVSEICNALPKPVNSDGIILVQAPQSSASVPNNNPHPTRPINIIKKDVMLLYVTQIILYVTKTPLYVIIKKTLFVILYITQLINVTHLIDKHH